MKRIDVKIALLLSVICFVGGFFLVPYQLESFQSLLNSSDYAKTLEEIPFSTSVLTIISSFQVGIISFIIAFAGLKIARRTGLSFSYFQSIFEKGKKATLKSKSVWLALSFGAITGFVNIGADKYYFRQLIPELGDLTPETSLIGMLAGMFYGGIFEEVLMRLLVMSLLVWVFHKIFTRKKENIPGWNYWLSIIIAAGLFAAGHLPATTMFFGELTGILIFRCFLLNGIGGLFFGYLYWKKGLEYSIIAHMFTHITMQLIFTPLFY